MPKVYAIVISAANADFDDVAARSTPALQAAGLQPLYLSNPMSIPAREVDECDFEAWVLSHDAVLEVLNAEDEPYPVPERAWLLAGLAGKAIRSIGELIDQHGLGRRAFDRMADRWDEFEQELKEASSEECDCRGVITGVHWPTKADCTDPPEGWSWVERCDLCERFDSDEDAARALNEAGYGDTFGWFNRYDHESVGVNQYTAGASVAINVPETADPEFRAARITELRAEIEYAYDHGWTPEKQLCELDSLQEEEEFDGTV